MISACNSILLFNSESALVYKQFRFCLCCTFVLGALFRLIVFPVELVLFCLSWIETAVRIVVEFLDVVSQVSSELELTPLLQKIISTISKMLDCESATLFINDEKTNELYTEVGEGLDEKSVIRFPNLYNCMCLFVFHFSSI